MSNREPIEFTTLLLEAEQYPLALRIAVYMHRRGFTELMFFNGIMPRPRTLGEPIWMAVANYVRDIERGLKLSPRLIELADQLAT